MLTRSDPGAGGVRRQMHQAVDVNHCFKRCFYPLTLPLTVGPGLISIAITPGANEPRHLGANVLAVGQSGKNVILRLSAFS
jgi:small neutral amino acid transporter SnatA (MarC family)